MQPESPIPVTVLTGFLGAGKTTLLNRLLGEPHGRKIAVIENEFGEAGVDNDFLLASAEQVVVMNNGCLCCTVRGDLVRILAELADARRTGRYHFDQVVIETTGLADPAPVAQTFFVEDAVRESYRLDAIITVVDAVHGMAQLDQHHEAQEQAGFADRILVSKTDRVGEADYHRLLARLRSLNRRATIQRAQPGQIDLAGLLDVRGFDLDDILEIEPGFLEESHHHHDDSVQSFVIRETRPYDGERLQAAFEVLATTLGQDMLRYKGVLWLDGEADKIAFQGVHMIMGGEPLRPWRQDETRASVLVFIGRHLPEARIREVLSMCVAERAPAQSKETTT
ncbi:MAG: CobW family GTP-binding protein [Burkholderiales bacterium]